MHETTRLHPICLRPSSLNSTLPTLDFQSQDQPMTCWLVFVPHPQMPEYLPSVFVNEAPHVPIAKTKSNQSQEREATLLEVLHSCLMSMYRWEDR